MTSAIGVVEFAEAVEIGRLCRAFAEDGCWIRPMGKVIYLTPPLVIGDQDLATLAAAVCRQVDRPKSCCDAPVGDIGTWPERGRSTAPPS